MARKFDLFGCGLDFAHTFLIGETKLALGALTEAVDFVIVCQRQRVEPTRDNLANLGGEHISELNGSILL